MLVIVDIDLFDFLLEHLLLVFFDHFVALVLHFMELLSQLRLPLGICLYLLLYLGDFHLYLGQCTLDRLVLVLSKE